MDLYSTHIEPIKKIFDFIQKPKIAIEFGMGNYSTQFLIENCEYLISIEMQYEDWYNKMVEIHSKQKNWKPVKSLGSHNFLKLEYPQNIIDFVFVDGHGSSRPDCINFMIEKNCPVIVAHDTEESSYGWNRVTLKNYETHIFKDFTNWTTLWTTNTSLLDYLKK